MCLAPPERIDLSAFRPQARLAVSPSQPWSGRTPAAHAQATARPDLAGGWRSLPSARATGWATRPARRVLGAMTAGQGLIFAYLSRKEPTKLTHPPANGWYRGFCPYVLIETHHFEAGYHGFCRLIPVRNRQFRGTVPGSSWGASRSGLGWTNGWVHPIPHRGMSPPRGRRGQQSA
jgi:hypothetical protein